MDWEYEKIVRAALRLVPGLGSIRLRRLIDQYGSACNVWKSKIRGYDDSSSALYREISELKSRIDLDKFRSEYIKKGIGLTIPEESNYPKLLAQISDAPPLLYYRGGLTKDVQGIAIVGARKATAYGKASAKYLGQELAKAGYAVVSGLARGIDTAAHEGAISAHGITWAFLGSGVDVIYPPENKNLAERIMEQGALISEFIPGTPPQPPHFPARNRLISGASMGVIVAEAAQKSGALITVDFALEQGREVFAVPGPIFSEMSRGTNQLLKTGAKLVEGIDDIIPEIKSFSMEDTNNQSSSPEHGQMALFAETKGLTKLQQAILDQLCDMPLALDELVQKCKSSHDDLALALLELELEGMVEQLPGQCYVLARHG